MKIAKCPWCGKEAELLSFKYSLVACMNVECGGIGPSYKTQKAAVAAWNRVSEAAWGKEAAYD